MLHKGCECREKEMEEWKHNWNEDFMREVRRERKETKWRARGRREREKVKCHKMFGDRKG
jgi:hypothetical protein